MDENSQPSINPYLGYYTPLESPQQYSNQQTLFHHIQTYHVKSINNTLSKLIKCWSVHSYTLPSTLVKQSQKTTCQVTDARSRIYLILGRTTAQQVRHIEYPVVTPFTLTRVPQVHTSVNAVGPN